MHGVINLLKPPGMTSHDAVAVVRRATGIKRVGHTGTLDPAAAGVLPICVGQATRLVEYLQAGTKEYVAELTFGYETDMLDATGTVTGTGDASAVTLETLRHALDGFRGTIQQTPPLYSAIKQGGKKLYELARAGVAVDDVEIKAREVTISRLMVSKFMESTGDTLPRAMLDIECTGGTYIRSLVRDIGRAVGCPATMTFLVRSRSGAFPLREAMTCEQVVADATGAMLPILDVLRWCTGHVVVDDENVEQLVHGRRINATVGPRDGVRLSEPGAIMKWKERRINAITRNNADPSRVLFLNRSETIAALAYPVSPDTPNNYQPEKVFHLAEG